MSKQQGWDKVEMSPTWNYKVDKEIIGFFKGVEHEVGPNNSNMYNFETPEGTVGVWGTTLLDARLKNLKEGEEIKIVYLGKATSPKSGREYHNFEVYHREVPMTKVEADLPEPTE